MTRRSAQPRYEMHVKDVSESGQPFFEVTQVDTRERNEVTYTVSFAPDARPPYISSWPAGREVSPDGALGRRILRAIEKHREVYS